MKVLSKNVIVLKQKPEYSGMIQGVSSEESTYAKVMGIGTEVTLVSVEDIVLLDWNKAKKIKNDLYVIQEEDIVSIMDETDLQD
jgi:hypothetical protein